VGWSEKYWEDVRDEIERLTRNEAARGGEIMTGSAELASEGQESAGPSADQPNSAQPK